MSSGGALPPQLSANFSPYSYLFPSQQPPFTFAHHQRIKLKRQRQRVDAGEPRNSYQQPRTAVAPTTPSSKADSTAQAVFSDLFPSASWVTQSNSENDEMARDEEATDLRISTLKEPEGVETNCALDNEEKQSEQTDDARKSNEGSYAGESSTSTSSSSRRKSFFPQKTTASSEATARSTEQVEENEANNMEDLEDWEKVDTATAKEETLEDVEEPLSALQAQLTATPVNKFNDAVEAQKKFYASIIEQHKKMAESEKPKLQRDLNNLAATLKSEMIDCLSMQIDKVIAEFTAAETARNCAIDNRGLLLPPFYQFPSSQMVAPFSLPCSGSIFPPAFPFGLGALNSATRKPLEEGATRKRKQPSETPSVRSKMTATASPVERDATPGSERGSPSMTRSTPLSSYFPTMVGHPIYGGGFDREGSPNDSDDISDCGPYDPNMPVSSTLTPMHLRKAKLMFFYTRYPNSSLLKTYFPDIRFNKNNTAQLVKWFSNFREFYYIQMEKYARQAVAEGIRNREEIVVTAESEIFKTLNQHYNRNNHIQPPERLTLVIQETMREFFVAILQNKDTEPSWKKTIYKVICRLDDPIPDYFKDPNFLERLE